MKPRCPLVIVEWEDSRQPSPGWGYLSGFEPGSAVRCTSVGWLIHDGDDLKALAPNLGDLDADVQASGVIQIPTRCVIGVSKLKEPRLTSS